MDDDFDTMMQNALLYGMGVLVMTNTDGVLSTRVIPIEHYLELGDELKRIAQTTKVF
jgi:hypothetical protein